MKNHAPVKTGLLLALLIAPFICLYAQFPYHETFRNTAAPGLVVSGAGKLTAAAGIDVPGAGYLRLTENTNNSVGYVYSQADFPSNYGITASFEFFTYKPGALSYNQADGISFFLFDASVNSFRPGGMGGSMGYAQLYNVPGLAKGYMGIAIDEYGNFSSPVNGNKNGGPGRISGTVSVRGPGDGAGPSDYVYQTGVITGTTPYNIGFSGFTQRYPDSTHPNYRKVKIILTPGSSLGPDKGFRITVIMYKGGATLTPVTLIKDYDYPFTSPPQLKYGLAGSTGSNTDFHEVRNMVIEATDTANLLPPVINNDNGVMVCQGGQALLDVTANDSSANRGGVINKSTLDLDPFTNGRQTSFTDPGKGVYTVNDIGIVTFIPANGFIGTSSIPYTVADNYGKYPVNAAYMSVSVGTGNAPTLTVSNPSGVCYPSTVDITNPTLKTASTAGAVYDYFANLSDANSNTRNINTTAAALTQSGTYYIRSYMDGCATIQPVTVQVNKPPTLPNAGADLLACNPAIGQTATLLANNPDVGTGLWSQVSGPSVATISYPQAATSPVSDMAPGVYVFRWTIANGACPAHSDDVQVTVGVTSSVVSNLVNAIGSTTTLQANSPAPGTGMWSQVSGPPIVIQSPSSPTSAISGLTPGNTYVMAWKVSLGGCSNSSQVTISYNLTSQTGSILPVRFTAFDAERKNNNISLDWKIATIDDLDHFEIERSVDGNTFTTIGSVEVSGMNYSYLDTMPSDAQTVYYRIKAVSKDNSFTYSKVLKLSVQNQYTWNVWPNPFTTNLYVSFNANANEDISIELYNAAGQLMIHEQHHVVKGMNQFNVSTSGIIAPGTVFIKLITKQGEFMRKLIHQR